MVSSLSTDKYDKAVNLQPRLKCRPLEGERQTQSGGPLSRGGTRPIQGTSRVEREGQQEEEEEEEEQ
ncbi:unnamed protein product [Boreogadus saida]